MHHTASPTALVHFFPGTTLDGLLAKRAARTFGDSSRWSTSSAASGLSAEATHGPRSTRIRLPTSGIRLPPSAAAFGS